MILKEITDDLFDADITIQKIVWLGANAANLGGCDAFTDWAEMADEKELIEHFGETGKELIVAEDYEELSSYLCRQGKCGFIVELHTPRPEYIKGSTSYRAGWGCTTLETLYTDDLNSEEFIERCLSWREEVHAKALEKAESA